MEILVELTYVMLLPYFKGDVSFQYQNCYEMIQDMPLESVALDFSLTSQRTIMELEMPGFLPLITNDGYNAHLELSLTNEADLDDFVVTYTLDPEQFGLYGMSTKLDEVPDELPEGFCLFIAEPDPNNSQIVISNPVLLSPTVTFGREAQAGSIYPNPLPNVYQGYQMLVSGRYVNGGETSINLDGYAYGENVHYQYNLDLAHEPVLEKQFITKIWAKLKIENLLALYYSYLPDSAEAQALKDQIIEVSLDYGVMSPFTAFSGTDPDDPPIDNEDDTLGPSLNKDYVLKGNFPNPFNPETTIQFTVNNDLHALVKVKIYNLRGQVVRTLALHTNGKGDYEVLWDGNDNLGRLQPSAINFYVIDFGHAQLSGK